MPFIIDENTGAMMPLNTGAVENETGGLFSKFRENRAVKKVENNMPAGMVMLESSKVEALLDEVERLKAAKVTANIENVQSKMNGGAMQTQDQTLGGGQGLSISASAPFAGDQASTDDVGSSSYTFVARRYRLIVTGGTGFGVGITRIEIAQTNLVNGGQIQAGPNQNGVSMPLLKPVLITAGVPVTISRQGSTGVNAATGNYTLILEP